MPLLRSSSVPADTQHIARAIEEALYGLYASQVCNGYIQQARVLKANFKLVCLALLLLPWHGKKEGVAAQLQERERDSICRCYRGRR